MIASGTLTFSPCCPLRLTWPNPGASGEPFRRPRPAHIPRSPPATRPQALLNGLSPEENRRVPPLKYDVVRALARDFPGVRFSLNGA